MRFYYLFRSTKQDIPVKLRLDLAKLDKRSVRGSTKYCTSTCPNKSMEARLKYIADRCSVGAVDETFVVNECMVLMMYFPTPPLCCRGRRVISECDRSSNRNNRTSYG